MMKTKILCIIVSSVLILGSINGCGKTAAEDTGSQDSAEGQETANGQMSKNGKEMSNKSAMTEEEIQAIAAAAEIEMEPYTEVKDWETKASIKLDANITIDGSGAAAEGQKLTIQEGGAYEITGELDDGMIFVNTKDDVKLLLNGVTITNSSGPAIYVYDSGNTYIELADNTKNVLTDGKEYAENADKTSDGQTVETAKAALFSNDDLFLTGTGSLTVTGNYKHAICSDDMVYVEEGSLTLSAVKDGIHANDGICLDGGSIEVLTANDGLESEGAFVINGGTVTAAVEDDGLTTLGNMTVNDGTVKVTACEEGLEAKNNLVINGGTIEVTGNDDGLNGGSLVQINGGNIYCNSAIGDAVDSNGNLELTGGLVLALGADGAEGGADCDQNTFAITGGTLIATGGTNSSPSETDSTQISVLLGAASAGDEIAVSDSDGKTVFAFKVSKAYSNLLLSTPQIQSKKDYTASSGGTIKGTETFYGYYADAEYSGDSESVSFTADSMVVSAGGTAGMQGGHGGGQPGNGEKPGNMPGNGDSTGNGNDRGGRKARENGELPDGTAMPEGGELPDGIAMPEDGELAGWNRIAGRNNTAGKRRINLIHGRAIPVFYIYTKYIIFYIVSMSPCW